MYFSFFLKLKQKYDENVDFYFLFLRKIILVNKCVNLKKNQIKKLIEIHDLYFFKEYQIKKLIAIHNLR